MYTLADAILEEDLQSVRQLLRYEDINELDEYGFRPLIEAAIVNNVEISKLLLANGADPNKQDATGGTALHWAAENDNAELCGLLLKQGANPNACNFAGQPVLAMPTLRHQSRLKQLLVKGGADQLFCQDYINTKLLGHIFELVGVGTIVDPNHDFVEVDFEGFFLEITLGLIADSLAQFQNHFAARQLRRYSGIAQFIVGVIHRASALIKYQQYLVDIRRHAATIDDLIRQEPLLIPVGYEGHAITFIRYGDIWVKCDRREDSRLYDNIMFYRVRNMHNLTADFVKNLMFEKQTNRYINHDLDSVLGLEPLTELKVEAQISGNCSWANVEAVIPSLFFLTMMQTSNDPQAMAYNKSLALTFFNRWREWNKDRALHYCIQSFQRADMLRKASKAEILAAILFQRCDYTNPVDQERIELILSVLLKSPYEYILKNYLRVYYYEANTPEGRRFSEMLKAHGFKASG